MAEDAQAIEGYGCTCGFRTTDNREISRHVFKMSGQDGKGTHKSLGRINLQTGEVIMPPYRGRTPEQKRQSKYAKRGTEQGGRGVEAGTGRQGQGGTLAPSEKTTDILADAQELRFITRVYTTDYSPIMRAAQDAAVKFWGWRANMPLGNFIDTCLHLFFEEAGITLAGYTISDEAREAIEARKAQETQEIKEEVA